MPLFEITNEALSAVPETSFSEAGVRERQDLQRLLRDNIEVISPGTLLISEEFGDWEDSRRRVDLLGIDKQANLVVIELKRTDDGGHMELQAIRYAAMVSTMTFAKAVETYRDFLAEQDLAVDADQKMLDHLGWSEPDEDAFCQDVRVVLAAANFSMEITTAVLWLNERDLDIRCVRLSPYLYDGKTLLDVQQVIPLPEAQDLQIRIRDKAKAERSSRTSRAPWSGIWYVNVGMSEDSPRDWEHCRRHGFVSAGGGKRYVQPLYNLREGSTIVAYQKGKGYVGYGIVSVEAAPIDMFVLPDGRQLSELCPALNPPGQPQELLEHAVGVLWQKTYPLDEAKYFHGMFANQNIVCKLREPKTVQFVCEEFDILTIEAVH